MSGRRGLYLTGAATSLLGVRRRDLVHRRLVRVVKSTQVSGHQALLGA